MSGFEVAGVVLGVLPLAVKALEAYMGLLSNVRHAQRDLKTLIRDLETEQLRLQNTCELLINGVAPPSVIDKLIQTPFGPEWKPYNDRLRLRLWTTCGKFEEQVAEMQMAANELRAKLCLEADGSTKLTDRLAIIRELKNGTSFTLKKKDYDETFARIKTANSVLQDLAGQNCSLEPTRRHRSQARLIRLIRGLARSIYNALLCGLPPCSCVMSHNVCLELEPRDAILVPTDSEDEVAKRFNFHMVMSSQNAPAAAQDPGSRNHIIRWESIHVKLAETDDPKLQSTSTTSLPSVPVTVATPKKSPSGIRWPKSLSSRLTRTQSSQNTSTSQMCTTVSSSSTLVEMSQSLAMPPPCPSEACIPTRVPGLCQTVFRSKKALAVDRYGYIADTERRFELRPPRSQADSRTTFTLRTLLNEKNTTLPPFDYPEKLRVAVALSISMLHLFSTPWLSSVVTLDDVLFFHEDNSHPEFTYQPFVIKTLHQQQAPQCQPTGTSRPVNLAVLSLGALLIQLIIGRVVEALDMTGETMDMNAILSKHTAGRLLGGEVLEKGGIHYATVVNWCLSSVLEVAGLEDENYCQGFYGAVVAKLEEDARATGAG